MRAGKLWKLRVFVTMLLLLSLTASLWACGRTEKPQEETVVMTGKLLPTALISRFPGNTHPFDMDAYFLLQDRFYYKGYFWDREKEQMERYVYCLELSEGQGEAVRLLEYDQEGNDILAIMADRQGNCYAFGKYIRERQNLFYLEKCGPDGERSYLAEYTEEDIPYVEGCDIVGGAVEDGGRLCLYTQNGTFYFFDGEGGLAGRQETDSGPLEGMAMGAQGKAYAYAADGEEIVFTTVDLMEGKAEAQAVRMEGYEPFYTRVFSGYEKGLYLSGKDGLDRYDPQTGVREALLEWDDPYINLSGSSLRAVSAQEDGTLLAVLWNDHYESRELAQIVCRDQALLKRREEITLGVVGGRIDLELQEMIRRFNRRNTEWTVTVISYGEAADMDWRAYAEGVNKLNLALLQGEGPDLVELRSISAENLVSKGVFEDLEEYFARSDSVGREDILEPVWQAGYVAGEMVGVVPSFSLSTLISKSQAAGEGWNVDKALDMAKGEDWDSLLESNRSIVVFDLIMEHGKDHFIDYENGVSAFGGEEFIGLLERLEDMEESEESAPLYRTVTKEDFLDGNYLLEYASVDQMRDILSYREVYGRSMPWVGYPVWDGPGVHTLTASCRLAINSASGVKDGAWEFLEFLLSDEVQERGLYDDLTEFPARKDSFERFLAESYPKEGGPEARWYVAQEEDFALARELVENAVFCRSYGYYDTVDIILEEETWAFFEGGAGARETAERIHSRVQLYLDELR